MKVPVEVRVDFRRTTYLKPGGIGPGATHLFLNGIRLCQPKKVWDANRSVEIVPLSTFINDGPCKKCWSKLDYV